MKTSIITSEQAKNQMISVFKQIYPTLSEELIVDIHQSSELIRYKKKQFIVEVGQVCKHIYFIIQGAVRTYYMNSDDQEVSSWLLFENEVAISVYSFFSQKPSFETMQTLEDSVFLRISYQNINRFYSQYVESNFIGRYLTEQYYIRSEANASALRTLSSHDRYVSILKNQPDLVKRVPLGYLASYLGMNNATLSRIRSGINRYFFLQ